MQPGNSRRVSTSAPRMKREFYQRSENSDIVSYICNTWNEVTRGYKSKAACVNAPSVYFQPDQLEVSNRLSNFERFDLEGFWGKKAFQNCRGSNRSP